MARSRGRQRKEAHTDAVKVSGSTTLSTISGADLSPEIVSLSVPEYKMLDGTTVQPSYYTENASTSQGSQMGNRPGVVSIPFNQIWISGFSDLAVTSPQGYGSKYFMQQLFNVLIGLVQSRGRFVPQSAATLTQTNSLEGWLGDWGRAYGILKMLKACLGIAGYNRPADEIQAAVSHFIPDIISIENRLMGVPIPMGLVHVFDQCNGAFLEEPGGPIYISYANAEPFLGAPVPDLRSSSYLAQLVTDANTMLTGITGGGGGAGSHAYTGGDCRAILAVFGTLYQYPKFAKAGLELDPGKSDLVRTMMIFNNDGTNSRAEPYAALLASPFSPSNDAIPFLARKGATNPYLISWLRPQVCQNSFESGTSQQIGLMQQENVPATPTYYEVYLLHGGASDTFTKITNQVGASGTPLYIDQGFVWTSLANNGFPSGPNPYNLFNLVLPGYDFVWVTPSKAGEVTLNVLRRIFLADEVVG